MKSIILFLLLLSAGNFSLQTDLFKEYLHKKHKSEISNAASAEYYVIREDNCYSCYINNFAVAKKGMKKKNAFLVYVYKGRMKGDAKFLKKHKNVLYDSTGAFYKVNVSPFNDCIIYTTKGKITKIKKLQN